MRTKRIGLRQCTQAVKYNYYWSSNTISANKTWQIKLLKCKISDFESFFILRAIWCFDSKRNIYYRENMQIMNRVKIEMLTEIAESDGSKSEFGDPGNSSELILPHFSSSWATDQRSSVYNPKLVNMSTFSSNTLWCCKAQSPSRTKI